MPMSSLRIRKPANRASFTVLVERQTADWRDLCHGKRSGPIQLSNPVRWYAGSGYIKRCFDYVARVDGYVQELKVSFARAGCPRKASP